MYVHDMYTFVNVLIYTKYISLIHVIDPSSVMSPYHTSLPPKNGPLTSSIGSVATLTTVADEQVDPEECGMVAGWVANFDKLLNDPLGVKCLLVSWEREEGEGIKREGGRERGVG